jgi:hypothetical protein
MGAVPSSPQWAPGNGGAVAGYAVGHGLAGLVARGLARAEEATGFHPPVRDELDRVRHGQLARRLVAKAAARRVADTLAARQIPFVPFKGIVLAEEVYGDLSLRDFGDFDAMVPRERVDEAFAAATELGYRLSYLGHVREYVRAGAHAAGMEHPDGSAFDLHWRLAPDMRPETEALVWRHCVPAGPAARFPGLRLSPELTLIHLAKHFHSTQYMVLRSLVDFHVAAQRLGASIDASALEAVAREFRVAPVLDIVSALRERTFPREAAEGAHAPQRMFRTRVGMHFVTEELMLDNPFRPRIGNWLRFLAASGTSAAAARSLGEILVPGRLELTRFFRRPFDPGMYPRYYWRQLVKVFTLARK